MSSSRCMLRIIAVAAGLSLAACGNVSDGDADSSVATDAPATIDSMPAPDAPGADAIAPPAPAQTGIAQTAGGGRTSSASYTSIVRIGAPQPMGSAQSSSYTARIGPGPH